MNYAWANPSTGIREQASTKEEARLQAWEAGHRKDLAASVRVYEQESAGWVSRISNDRVIKFLADPWESYAWVSPANGKRYIESCWEDAVDIIQADWPEHAPVDTVTVYQQRLAFIANWDDPKPELPSPVEIPPDTPQSLIQQVLDGTCPDPQRAQILAMLWIAEALQGDSPFGFCAARTRTRRNPRRHHYRRYPNLWGYIRQAFRRWWRGKTFVWPPQAGAREEDEDPTVFYPDGDYPNPDEGHACKSCRQRWATDGDLCKQCAAARSGGTSPNKSSFPEYSELPPETEDQANERRVRLIKERNKSK